MKKNQRFNLATAILDMALLLAALGWSNSFLYGLGALNNAGALLDDLLRYRHGHKDTVLMTDAVIHFILFVLFSFFLFHPLPVFWLWLALLLEMSRLSLCLYRSSSLKMRKSWFVLFLAAALFGGWRFFVKQTKLDAFSTTTVSFTGYDGAGYAVIRPAEIDYDLTNAALGDFVYQLRYETENDGKLSNGDKAIVHVIYSKEAAQKLRVGFLEESKTFEVSGLALKYPDAKSISQEKYHEAYMLASRKAHFFEKASFFYKAYYLYQPDEQPDCQYNRLIFVFAVPYKTTDAKTNEKTQKIRYVSYFTAFDSNFDKEKAYFSFKTLYSPSGGFAADKNQVTDAVKYSYAISDCLEEVPFS